MNELVKPLIGKIALVTGASRGVGKGIAISLSLAGATVYITGRTTDENSSASGLQGSIHTTAEEIKQRGGTCTAIQCDHRNDKEVEKVFETIATEHNSLDILVNNVWGGYEHFTDGTDQMVACMANKLLEHNIATVSIYPGLVRTESVLKAAEYLDLSNSESPQFIGRAIAALASDSQFMKKTGLTLIYKDTQHNFTVKG